MTPKQFQATLDRLGLTQAGMARMIGSDPRTARHYAAGTRSVPECVAILLRLMLAGKITQEDVEGARK
jgi:hypothetical protein